MKTLIVEYLRLKAAEIGGVDEHLGLTEQRQGGDVSAPYIYVGNGDVRPVDIDSGSLGWFRTYQKEEFVTVDGMRAAKDLQGTFYIRYAAILHRDTRDHNEYAEDIANTFTGVSADLKQILKARTVNISRSSIETDITRAWREEFTTPVTDLNYRLGMVLVDVTVNVTGSRDCWQGCAELADILQGFDWCNPATFARLTPAQQQCVAGQIPCEDAEWTLINTATPPDSLGSGSIPSGDTGTIIAPPVTVLRDGQPFAVTPSGDIVDVPSDVPPCADASVTVNTTPFTTAPSGGSANVPVQNTATTPIGSDVAGVWQIPDHELIINNVTREAFPATVDVDMTITLGGQSLTPAQLTYDAGTNTANVIPPPPSQAWVRDPNWQAMPALDSSGERFDGLFLVFENEFNMVTVTTNVGATLDPGDGSAPIAGTGGNIFHIYDYATMAGAVNVYQPIDDVPPRNYKQAMVRVTGTITALSFGATSLINGNGTNNFVDVQASLPNRTGNSFRFSNEVGMGRNMGICERGRVFNWTGAYATANAVFGGMTSMRVVQIPTAAGSLDAAFSTCSQLDLGDLTTSATILTNMGRPNATAANFYHSIRSAGHIVANSVTGTGLTTMFFTNSDIQYVLSLTGTLATSLSSYATSARQLRYHGLITCPAVTNISNIFNGCVLLKEVRFSDCSAVNTAVTPFLNMPSLEILEVPNLDRGVSVAGSAMGNDGALIWANSLGTASGSQTNTVTGTPFGALLTALNPTAVAIEAIMTGKGFTVAN
jgi:hypothetical protein